MATFISRSPEETRRLGETWGESAAAGWVVGITGDLGAGKTELVRGLARGLGIHDPIHSPTFALVHEYTGGRLPLFHLDLYRLESPAQIINAGLEEYLFQPNGVTVIEWVERWGSLEAAMGPGRSAYHHVAIDTLSENERRITYA